VIIGLYKTEVARLHSRLGYLTPAEYEAAYFLNNRHADRRWSGTEAGAEPETAQWVWAAGQVTGPDPEKIFSGLRRAGRG
jgi:hypothetical protein